MRSHVGEMLDLQVRVQLIQSIHGADVDIIVERIDGQMSELLIVQILEVDHGVRLAASTEQNTRAFRWICDGWLLAGGVRVAVEAVDVVQVVVGVRRSA